MDEQIDKEVLNKRHAARTKLLMKFWAAMHIAGFPPEQEWDAQEKISIRALAEILGARKETCGRNV